VIGQLEAVHLTGVTRVFDGLAAVTRVNLDIGVGEVVWLRGPNGSGKTTLLRLVSTAISPTFGRGSVLGYDLDSRRASIRARTDLLGHQARLYEDLTATENLRFACRLYGLDGRAVAGVLDRVGLSEVATVRAGAFSQGMRQRLALARCILRSPQLILLDEPYAGLDVDARILVDDLLVDARANGQTVLFASHEAPPPELVDRHVVMAGGSVVQGLSAPAVASA
jgi:ABC-type multidrug transport system ATPase subunit